MIPPVNRRLLRSAFGVLSAAILSASCAGGPSFGGGGGLENYAAASALATDLRGRDVDALGAAFGGAMDGARAGEEITWSGPNARGSVLPGQMTLGGLRADPGERLPFPPGLDISHPLETELGEYVMIRKSNVRAAPSVDAAVLTTAQSGAGVTVIGKVVGQPWMLIAAEGRIRGYVFEDLLTKRPGTELELAGGPTKRPVLCRDFLQKIAVNGRSDRWGGTACKRGERWRLERAPENAPAQLY